MCYEVEIKGCYEVETKGQMGHRMYLRLFNWPDGQLAFSRSIWTLIRAKGMGCSKRANQEDVAAWEIRIRQRGFLHNPLAYDRIL